jgi:deoxyribose-phosphate aldolase
MTIRVNGRRKWPVTNDKGPKTMTPCELAGKIDHTILKPEATRAEVDRILSEAKELKCASACIAPAWVRVAVERLKGSGVLVCTVASFPHGTCKSSVKAIEATVALKDGADEVDVVAHLPYLAAGDFEAARGELVEVVKASRAVRRDAVVKVIIESAYLLTLGAERGEAAIATACRAARESGCDFVKTSTGFHPAGGASLDAIKLMKKHGDALQIKASGGIRDLATALAMLEAGADRLGMSASVAVLNDFGKKN